LVHRDRRSPCLELRLCFLLRSLLLRCLLGTPPTAATGSARCAASPFGLNHAALAVPASHLRSRGEVRRVDGATSASAAGRIWRCPSRCARSAGSATCATSTA